MNKKSNTVPVDTWHKCYSEGWKSLCVNAAFQHPAKFARGLIRRIYQHLSLPPGSLVLDPFGGVALGALDALLSGLTWIGCELEPKFHSLGNDNLAEWAARWGHVPGFGKARLVCGDSRRLRECVSGVLADCVVSSPPFMGAHSGIRDETSMRPPHTTPAYGRDPNGPSAAG